MIANPQSPRAIESFTITPLSLLKQQSGELLLNWQQQQAVDLSASKQWQATAPSLVCFGGDFSWHKLEQILKQLAVKDGEVLLRLWQPLAELPAAIAIQTAGLSAPAQPILTALAAELDCQLVYLAQPPTLVTPGLLVMDMDSTAIQIECIDEIAKLAGVGEQVAAVTARAMNGELDFAQSLRQRVAALAGAPESVLAEVLATLPLMPGLEALVAYLQQHGWRIAIASGGFTYFTAALQQQLKLDATFANQLEIVDGKLTGQVLGDIVDANRKAQVVEELAERYQIARSQTVAIGDGANDLPMLARATLGVAFHAKPKVQAAAKAAITQGSLLQLLYLVSPT
ncbi:phosphoserine phosphatase [Alishewanella longhuensis]|uniref:Phosphoserine phosphatase n=1 Tax=Alishewanella longhuensis TaxID=1091037 RepID=A0ABQ3L0I2_9ALTE|nr:phosphoserine phosphatase SerB [Alishewanella longhuensis]GHG68734.1 phosphoserine phosphatase [Alishewanella longhuensis]